MKRVLVIVGLVVTAVTYAADERPAHLLVLDLYAAGEYSDCRGLSARLIEDYEAGAIKVPAPDMARVYLVSACLADVYRGAGYAEAVEQNIDRALALDPNVDATIADTRSFVKDRFVARRGDLLASQGPAGRRFSIGFMLSAEGPGGIHWRDTPLVGLRFGVGIVPWLGLEAGGSFPVQEPPLDEGELWIGATYRPAFALKRLMPILSASYVATHAGAWTHGLRFEAGAELAFATGFSLRGTVELLRIDGVDAPDPDPGDYPSCVLFGAPITFSIPRITFCAAYSF